MIEALASGVQQALAPIDGARRMLYRAAAPLLGGWVLDRERRVVLLAALVASTSLLFALAAPLPLLGLGPIVLGVPHLLADLRYLVVQPGLHRRGSAVLLVAALFVATGVTGMLWPAMIGASLCALLLARASVARRLPVAAALVLIAAACWRYPRLSGLLFAHGHNLVAVGLWIAAASAVGRTGRWSRWGIGAIFVALGAPVALGAADGLLASTSSLVIPGGPRLAALGRALSPSADPEVSLRFVALYAYAQSVHYGLWLRLIPEDVRPRPAPRSFAASFQVMRAEIGAAPLLLSLLLSVALVTWAIVDLAAAREGYLRLALFHGPLELAAAGVLLIEGRRFFGGAR